MSRIMLRAEGISAPVLVIVSLLGAASCGGTDAAPLFTLLPPGRTGITFANTITTSDSVNVQTDAMIYNGGGVAIGDIDNDGLADVYLTGNMVSSRLYLNKGGMRFEDITAAAGVGTDRWCYGVSLVDIDNDGYLDLYVSVSGPAWTPAAERANLLFLNNGDRTFREAAAAYGLADTSFSTHAAFLDADRDGDLDLFLLNNDPGGFARGDADRRAAGVPGTSQISYDRFYRNDGDGTFTDVSEAVGILREIGFGLGVVVADFGRDGWPDLYVSNDDTPNDVLYVNNGDGTFTDKAAAWLRHTSYAGMGVDAADFNNDGWFDILQTDMVPEDLRARKRMSGALTYDGFMQSRRRGFHYDYSTNSLQLNGGVTRDGDVIFSEMSQLAGVAYTDWTWSPLFVDLDNDGYKDIHITNGYPKATIDYDFRTRIHPARQRGDREQGMEIINQLHAYHASNYVFRNVGDLTFRDETGAWGLLRPSFSYGAAYGDLDNDGRLDLVINNIDAPAFVYHNGRPAGDTAHYLQVVLDGTAPNRRGLGATLRLVAGGQPQYVYHSPYRGYLSTMDDRAHFGLGAATQVDTLEVTWPDGRRQVLTALPVDRVLTLRQADATAAPAPVPGPAPGTRPFQPLAADRGLRYVHQEKGFVDYSAQPLLPSLLSRQGPPLAVGDVTGDGRADVFLGGSAGFPGTLFVQGADGRFAEANAGQPWLADQAFEDWGALLFDATGDGQLDLYVASGGYHVSSVSALLQDRLYVNQGGGRFVRDSAALPRMLTSTAAVRAGDFTGDGRVDLVVGGRLVPRNYPYPTRSYLLRNDGGRFTDVTATWAPALVQPGGMLTDAVWVDFTGDGRLDLVTAGEWMPLQFFANDGDRFRDVTAATGLPPLRGWWYSLAAGDFNHDGRPDLVAGNLGLNSPFRTAPTRRFGVYANDFTGNGTTDVVLTQELAGTDYPYFGLAKLGSAIYTLDLRFPTYAAFATAAIPQIFSAAQLRQAVHYQVDTFASVYLQNGGDGTFTAVPLPNLAQLAPIRQLLAHDVDGDGHLDLLATGNLYYTEPNTPRADAGNGLWLRGDGHGAFTPVPPMLSGFLAPREVTALALLSTPPGTAVLVANNSDSLQTYVIVGR